MRLAVLSFVQFIQVACYIHSVFIRLLKAAYLTESAVGRLTCHRHSATLTETDTAILVLIRRMLQACLAFQPGVSPLLNEAWLM